MSHLVKMPTLEKGIPLPGKQSKRQPRISNKPPSPWIEFMKSVEPGDSIVLPSYCKETAKKYVKRYGFRYVWADIGIQDTDLLGEYIMRVRLIRFWFVLSNDV
jgi:hypothetical protein